jgi:hypothetical protein
MMAETIKSVLFVDYDSIHRSLKAANPQPAERLAERVGAIVAAIESGRLLAPRPDGRVRRRVLVKRCYADPRRLGKSRDAFAANGFEMIDCPPLEGRERNSADIHMALDAIDALEHPTGYDELILLSADADLTPVLLRLRAHNRSTVIYASAATTANYKALADAVIDEATLVALLSSEQAAAAPTEASAAERSGRPAEGALGERGEIEALARKVSAATNVPLFAPRTFAELFRALAEENAANGYHFQTTAENVAAKLVALGRNATRRQVVFVVKGLALKGHVFSTTDTPERLAEVFREQVLYLAGTAGLELDEKEKGLLSSWISGRAGMAGGASDADPARAASEAARRPAADAGKSARRRPARAETTLPPEENPEPAKPPAPVAAKPADPRKPVPASPPKAAEAPRFSPASPAKAAETPKPALAPASRAAQPPKPAPMTAVKPTEAARPAAPAPRPAAKPSPAPAASPLPGAGLKPATAAPSRPIAPSGLRPTAARPETPQARPAASPPPKSITAPPRPAAPGARPVPASAPPTSAPVDKDAIENSILAAIAQAVDVLVENSGGTTADKPSRAAEPKKADPTPPPTAARPEPPASEAGESDDIGDEIQRIIASYSHDRKRGGQSS